MRTAHDQPASRGRLLFLVTEDWYFCAHRMSLARAARDAGYTVIVATRVDKMGARITAEGFQLESLDWKRGSLNPVGLLLDVAAIARVYRRARPDIVHHVSLKPVLLGSAAAARVPGLSVLNALTGLGYTFTSRSVRARLVSRVVAAMLRPLLRRRATITLLENEDDRRFVIAEIGVPSELTAVNRGSGVDIDHFSVMPLPTVEPVTVACAARMLAIKGIHDVVAASRLLRTRGVAHRLVLAGGTDPENPDAIRESTLMEWTKNSGIEWLGPVADIRTVWRHADIAVLASLGGEGVPLSLVEAAACGRPLVATDVSGSRDIAQAGTNALVSPPGDPRALADALERLICSRELRESYSAASRGIVESGFSSKQVIAATFELYDRVVSWRPS